MSNIQDSTVNYGNNVNQGSVYTYDWSSSQNAMVGVQLPVYYNSSASSPDSLGIGLAIGSNNTFVAAASSPTTGGLGTNGGGLYVFSRSGPTTQFILSSFIPTLTAYSYYTPFVAMTTIPNPQILVGGSDLETVYKARWFNYTYQPVPTSSPTAIPTSVPTAVPTATPTSVPTAMPTAIPTSVPTAVPTATPTSVPTAV